MTRIQRGDWDWMPSHPHRWLRSHTDRSFGRKGWVRRPAPPIAVSPPTPHETPRTDSSGGHWQPRRAGKPIHLEFSGKSSSWANSHTNPSDRQYRTQGGGALRVEMIFVVVVGLNELGLGFLEKFKFHRDSWRSISAKTSDPGMPTVSPASYLRILSRISSVHATSIAGSAAGSTLASIP